MFAPAPPRPRPGGGDGPGTSRPYTALYVSGLRLGLTASDLASMPLPRLLFMMGEYSSMASGGEPATELDEPTDAEMDEFF